MGEKLVNYFTYYSNFIFIEDKLFFKNLIYFGYTLNHKIIASNILNLVSIEREKNLCLLYRFLKKFR